ncbi:protein IQ-DOMAIN 12-like isoform X2 [Phragmites australis]|uniref:protein IQ-DOMAIN 12-like isoform X2 n=1 Tax=Phragmites australis TaxID=29695 RepID=UPI002D76D70F|nr:protein IQ-DOMAIN 12-like isoform X2 [Phragmites australis]
MEKEKKRRSWFERIKRLFTSEPKQKPKPDKARSKRWVPGKLRTQQSFALPPPPPEPVAADQIRQAEEEQSKRAMAVALASAAAAEAAVAAAQAAAEVVRLTGQPASRKEQAAVAIQSAYRGYLGRRALRALKGLVRLQALIRGQAVRRQTAATLRGLESLMKIQARHRSGAAGHGQPPLDDDDALLLRRGRELCLYAAAVHEQEQSKGWDSSIFSKEEMSAMMRSREEAALKRVRALQYASIQNEKIGIRRQPMSKDEMETLNQRWSWLEEWVGSQPFDKDIPVAHQSPYRAAAAAAKNHQPAPGRARAVDPLACLGAQHPGNGDDRLGCSARRSFVRPRRTLARGDYYYDDATACSPAFPGYMASTASAKAKFRSMSTPKERSSGASDVYSEHCFPFADHMLSPIPSMSPIPSIASDIGFARSTRPPVAQRSPRVVKGPMTPARSRSRRSPSHHSFGSEAALHQLQMEHCTPVR